MKTVQLSVVWVAGVALAGCAGINADMASIGAGKTGGGTSAQCSYNPGYQRSDNCCILPYYVASVDVDTAFSRAMREYRFPTKVTGRGRNPDRIYRYESVRGQYHSAANDVMPQADRSPNVPFWLFLTLDRDTNSTSSVEAVYCEIPGHRPADIAAWHSAVQQSIRSTVPPR